MNAPSPERAALAGRQRRFAAYIRDPECSPPPADVSEPRMALYRTLFINNIVSLLDEAFPLASEFLPRRQWRDLIYGFFAEHPGRTPCFARLAGEFNRWLTRRPLPPAAPPFFGELVDFEWREIEASIAPDEVFGDSLVTNPMQRRLRLAPSARLLGYRWPVHRLHAHAVEVPHEPRPTRLLVWRDRDHAVRFLELNGASARLLELVADGGGATAGELLARIATELQHPDPRVVTDGGRALLADLREKGALLPIPPETREVPHGQ